jgi:5-methylcytosine-specific restriction endonuclease McrA
MTVDHKIPISSGGDNKLDNLVPACGDCNHAKGSLHPKQFKPKLKLA